MAQTIKLKRSAVTGNVPTTSQLELGELAINTYDGKVFIKKNDGTDSVVEVGSIPSGYNNTNWDTAYGWGDHSLEGYLTSLGWASTDTFTGTYPIVWNASNTPYTASWLNVNGATDTLHSVNFAASGTVTASGGNSGNWNTAYSWGDHSTQGYLTTYTDTTYSTATSSVLGLVKIGYAENGKNYPVELSNGQMFVNVPWVDTDTNTWRGIHDTPVDGATTTSISSNWAFDNVKTPVPAGAVFTDTDTNTTYSTNTAYGTSMSGTQIRQNGGEIPSSANLNDYRTQGTYCQNSNSQTSASQNYPENLAGILIVADDMYGNGLHTTQIYDIYNSQNIYSRTYYNGSWTAWRNLAQDTDTVYTHPTHAGDDINLDTGALSGATVISDLDFNVTTDTLGHVTDANATYSTRNLTAANIGAAPASHSHSNYLLNNTDDQMNGALTLYKAEASPTLLTLHNSQSDIAGAGNNQGNFIDFKMTDNNATFTPQVRVGMLVNDYSGDGGIPSEGTGNFVVYTSQGTDGSGNGVLTERFRVRETGDIYAGSSRMFADNYHPNADKWTTARTITLSGDLNGSVSIDGSSNVTLSAQVVNDSHTHDTRYQQSNGIHKRFTTNLGNVGNRWYKIGTHPNTNGFVQMQGTIGSHVESFGTSKFDLTVFVREGNSGAELSVDGTVSIAHPDTGVRIIRIDNDGGYERYEIWLKTPNYAQCCIDINSIGLIYDGSTYVTTEPSGFETEIDTSSWGQGFYSVTASNEQKVFGDDYHPNADKWTTARTISLSGDLTGSVSLDGSSNVTLSAQVVNDSHTHDGRYVNVTGDTMTGDLSIGSNKIKNSNSYYYTPYISGGIGTRSELISAANFLIHADTDGSGTGEFVSIRAGAGTANELKLLSKTSSAGVNNQALTLNGNKVFNDAYHPNADKWTSARTLTLSGDLTGSVSIDGSSNVTLSAQVVSDSHNHNHSDGSFTVNGQLSVTGNYIKFANLNDSITFEDTNNVYSFNTDGGTGNAPVRAGSYQVGTTTVIDSSRNIKDALRVNIGQSDTTGASNSRYLSIGGLWAGMGTSASLIVNGFGRINGNLHLHQEGTNKSAYFNNNGSELRLLGENMTGRLEVQGALRVTESGTAQHFLIGNQDSGGVNKPAMIRGVNGYLTFGHGSSWSGEGGTMTEVISLASNQLNLKTGNYQVNGTTVIDSSRNLVNVGSITASSRVSTSSTVSASSLSGITNGQGAFFAYHPTHTSGTTTYYPTIGSSSIHNTGYRQHLSIGHKRASAWDEIYIAAGGNDAYPTKEWLFDVSSGRFTSAGDIVSGSGGDISTGASGNINSFGNITATYGYVKSGQGGFYVQSTQIVDSARNLLNIGTVSTSGTITCGNELNASGDIYAGGGQVYANSGNADVKFGLWGNNSTTYGIGMTSGVTYGALNDYAMTFCMNNESDRGFWWGYSGQSKSTGAMSLTTSGVLTVASDITTTGTRMTINTSGSCYYTADGGTNQWKYLSLKQNGATKWDVATKEDDLSGALQFRPSGGATNRVYITTSGALTAPRIQVGDGTDGYFYSDTAGRTAYAGGDFYIQSSVGNYYNYATNQYHGNSSGDNHYFRSNNLSGTGWAISSAGAITGSSITSSGNASVTGNLTTLNGNVNAKNGLQINGTTVVDSGRNAVFGTIQGENSNSTAGVINLRDKSTSPGFTFIKFQNRDGTTTYGSIYRQYSSIVYATSSDYRLKENVVQLTSASDRVNALSVKRFNFIEHPEDTVDGFLAHEVEEVVPQAVLGDKDGVDKYGRPEYQSIDHSKLVPLLTAGLQEALAEIENLKARLSALEN